MLRARFFNRCLLHSFCLIMVAFSVGTHAQKWPTLSDMATPPPSRENMIRTTDPTFLRGADIYFGRKGYKKYEFCLAVVEKDGKYVAVENLPVGERVQLNRRSIKAFRRGELLQFLNAVFDCEAPTKLIFRKYDGK